MEKKITFFYTLVSILFLVITCLCAFFRILDSREQNLHTSRASLTQFVTTLESEYRTGGGMGSDLFRNAARSYMDREPSLSVILLYSYDDGLLYFLPRDSGAYDTRSIDFQGKSLPRLSYSFATKAKLSIPFSAPDRKGVVLEGLFTILDSDTVYPVLRDVLIAFSAFFLITCILIVISGMLRNRGQHTDTEEPPENDPVDEEPERERKPEGSVRQPPFLRERHIPFSENIPEYRDDAEAETFSIDDKDLDTSPLENLEPVFDLNELEPEFKPAPVTDTEPVPEAGEASGTGTETAAETVERKPGGNTLPDTDTVVQDDPETPVLTLVGSALSKSEKAGEELVLALIAFSSPNGAIPGRRATALIETTYREVQSVEPFAEETFLAVFPGTDLDEAIRETEKLYGHVHYEFGGSLRAGLTMRNGRTVNARRFLKEAEEALHRTRDERGERIIGFKPDPGRYRAVGAKD